jgi:hypothetical protein
MEGEAAGPPRGADSQLDEVLDTRARLIAARIAPPAPRAEGQGFTKPNLR